jgi:abortive infection bacteriophage resistance protein
MMLPPYAKPHLSFAEQVQLLKGRGLGITSEWHAERHLARIGYYRLKDYWHPLRQSRPVIRSDGSRYTEVLEDFRPDTNFEQAVALYIFDKRLRLLMSDAIERIEVALRVDMAHTLGQRDPFAHRDIRHLDPKRSIAVRGQANRHSQWLGRADEAEHRSRADWRKEFSLKYCPPLPIWMAVETWEFGSLSHLIEMAHPSDRSQISRKYGIADPELLTSWIKVLSYVRNVCAHHGRLWNHPLVNQPKLPKGNDAPMVAHIKTYGLSNSRVYGAAAVAQHFLRVINPNSAWKERMKNLWDDFPVIPAVNPSQAGFMPTWSTQALWHS